MRRHERSSGARRNPWGNGPTRQPRWKARAWRCGYEQYRFVGDFGRLLTAAAAHSRIHRGLLPPIYLLVLVPAYFILMVRFVRPILSNMVTTRMLGEAMSARALVVVGAAAIASALITELMGLHHILGAFLIGAILPANLHQPILDRLQVVTIALLMPFFFALTGMKILIDLHSPALLEMTFGVALAAVLGIVGGTAAIARMRGETWPFALGLGALLQSKGLTELIVITMLLDAGVISPKISFARLRRRIGGLRSHGRRRGSEAPEIFIFTFIMRRPAREVVGEGREVARKRRTSSLICAVG